MTEQVRPRRSDRFDAVDLDGGWLVYDGTELQLLEGVAAQIWSRLDGTASVEAIVADLAVDFGAPRGVVETDVRKFLLELECRAMLAAPSTPSPTVPAYVGWVRDDDEVLLIDLRDGRRRRLTPTAATVWESLLVAGTADDLLDRVRTHHADAPGDLPDVVGALLRQLIDEGFLVLAS